MTSSHAACTHPRTKAARAKCRKNQAEIAAIRAAAEAEDRAYHEAYIVPRLKQEAAEAAWNEAFPKFAEGHQGSAHQNADDTAREENFELYSTRWYEVALSTLHRARDCADRINWEDPESGQVLDLGNEYRWVDRVIWGKGWITGLILVDREGNRTEYPLIDLTPRD